MIEVNNINFTLNSTFDGIGQYIIYNSSDCNGDIVLSGDTNIVNGTSIININETLFLNQNISIKFTDIKNCNTCENYTIIEPICSPFTGSANYIEPNQSIPPVLTEFAISEPQETPQDGCFYSGTLSKKWHNGDSQYPTIDDQIFDDSNGITLFNGNNKWYAMAETELSVSYAPNVINIETNGTVVGNSICFE